MKYDLYGLFINMIYIVFSLNHLSICRPIKYDLYSLYIRMVPESGVPSLVKSY